MICAHVTEQARQELEKEWKTTTDAKWYRRVKIIDLSSQGQTVPRLAATCDVSPATVREYIRQYNAGGVMPCSRTLVFVSM